MTQRSLEQIPLSDGTGLRLTVAAPESVVRGGILVGPDVRGVTDDVWQLAAGLAGEGWLTVIPHLFPPRRYRRAARDGSDVGPPSGAISSS